MSRIGGEPSRIGIVIPCFNPPESLVERVERWGIDLGPVVAVDDGSPDTPEEFWKRLSKAGAKVIRSGGNFGIGHAINLGIHALQEEVSPQWVLTLDQDSDLANGYVSKALKVLSVCEEADRVGMLCSGSQNDVPVRKWRRFGRFRESFDPMQSGTLLRVSMLEEIGLLREDFFIDAVDSELNARARSRGWVLLAVEGCDLVHSLGVPRRMRILGKEVSLFGKRLFVHYHRPERVYYIIRNNVVLARAFFGQQPLWVLLRIGMEVESEAVRLLFGPHRGLDILATVWGLRDGLKLHLGRIRPELAARLDV